MFRLIKGYVVCLSYRVGCGPHCVNWLCFCDVVCCALQAISLEEGQNLAKEYNIHFFETSAKQDLNVESAFVKIATDVKNRLIADGSSGPSSGGFKATGGGANTGPKKGCC